MIVSAQVIDNAAAPLAVNHVSVKTAGMGVSKLRIHVTVSLPKRIKGGRSS
jgi:hypothetical protein